MRAAWQGCIVVCACHAQHTDTPTARAPRYQWDGFACIAGDFYDRDSSATPAECASRYSTCATTPKLTGVSERAEVQLDGGPYQAIHARHGMDLDTQLLRLRIYPQLATEFLLLSFVPDAPLSDAQRETLRCYGAPRVSTKALGAFVSLPFLKQIELAPEPPQPN